ncbi:type VI secretion system-associated protein TagO [Vibrio parahaemolyticus]|uniref:type VI secretion system-associated protein TagO n=1 Tax=Vibrio parahaemolyticus TaxID=670 RepID=UPI00054330EC|nr:type VI secretion system-associated protein TagO [Vibrio parahaemolyticus]ELU8562358.1 hypothetical protein [Vibrio parahaemolyticus]KHF17385.1 hypothetical protein PO80_02610 [Vibrio parahaemolyticus]MDF5022327.1 type VI secretion system-associated protein TagO [Vibrio parahaemolyticus]MDF5041597.1 type VI secretion system-associated protein TagO [Vibrio parahaemolyticus]MDF5157779.1 type VI secretion system-associated protein TagO [Vibrio parahaemolyticus]
MSRALLYHARYVVVAALLCCSSDALSSSLSDVQVKALLECRQESDRLTRLACFDEVIQTPTPAPSTHHFNAVRYPSLWQQIWRSQARQKEDVQVWQNEGENNAWIAIRERSELPPRAILALSCIDNLSRVDVLMAKPIEPLTLKMALDQHSVTLRSDDYGVMYSSARGVPAIDIMKWLYYQEPVSLLVDGERLQFETQEASALLPLLKTRCHW